MRKDLGIDTFSLYHKLTLKQKDRVIKRLEKLPEFYISEYPDNTYTYLSDFFADSGVRIWVICKKGKSWGVLIVVHPMLVLGDLGSSKLCYLLRKSEYQKIVNKVGSYLKDVNIPCSVDKMTLYRVDTAVSTLLFSAAPSW